MSIWTIAGALTLVVLLLAVTGVWAEPGQTNLTAPSAPLDVFSDTLSFQGLPHEPPFLVVPHPPQIATPGPQTGQGHQGRGHWTPTLHGELHQLRFLIQFRVMGEPAEKIDGTDALTGHVITKAM